MSRELDFQEMFKQNMNQLESIQQDIGRKLTEKSEFSKQILPKLEEINKKLATVRGKFNLLKQQLGNLEREIADKDKGIADAGTDCVGLQDEIQRLQQQLHVFGKEREELNNTVHSLGEENNQMLSKQQEMEQIINKLKEEESRLEVQINTLQQKLAEQQQFMEQLTNENKGLKSQHMELTQKISEIRKQINDLINADNTDPTPRQITELLQQITTILDEINSNQPPPSSEGGLFAPFFPHTSSSSSSTNRLPLNRNESFVSSSAAASPAVSPGSPKSSSRISPETQINIDVRNFMLGYIKSQLEKKSRQVRTGNPKANNKYQNALDSIRSAINANSIPGILNDNSIEFNSINEITGGKQSRKTRKTKKIRRRRQKGGYQYNEKTKRRRFTSSPKSSSPKSSNRRSSKTTSSLNKDKSKTRKTL